MDAARIGSLEIHIDGVDDVGPAELKDSVVVDCAVDVHRDVRIVEIQHSVDAHAVDVVGDW